MRRKPYPIVQLTGGLDVNVDALFLTDAKSPNLTMVMFHKGILKKDYGLADFDDDSPDSERPMLFDTYYQYDGDQYTMLATVDDLFYLSSGSWTALTGASTPEFTGDADDIFYSTVFNDLFIITNGKDAIHKVDSTTISALGGSPPDSAKCLVPFYNVLVLGHTIESGTACPYRLRWSDSGDPETWSGGNAGFVDLLDTPDFIMNIVPMGDRMFVFRERSIWELLYTGNTGNSYFTPRMVVDGIGTYAGRSCVNLGDRILFFGSDSIYTFDGITVQAVSDPLFPLLFETGEMIVGHSKLNRTVAAFAEETSDYILILPTNTNDNPNLVIKYNTRTGAFTRRTIEASALGYYTAQTQTTWSAATGNWEDADWQATPWRRQQLPSGAPTIIYCGTDGNIYEDDRTTYSTELMTWESKDFVFAQSHRWLFCELWVSGNAFDFSFSTDQGQTWSEEETYTPSSTTVMERIRAQVEVTSDKIRFRIRTYNEHFNLKTLIPWYIPRARAKEYA